jgi:hypothetical protein
MKKILLLISIILFSANLFAQGGFAGLLVRPQSAWILNDDDFDSGEFDLGIPFSVAFGAQGGYMFSESIGLELQFIFSKQGQTYIENGGSAEYAKITNKYFKIPLLFRLKSGGDKGGFLLVAGPQIGFLTSSSISISGSSEPLIPDSKNYYNSIDFGFLLGVGANIMLTDYLSLDLLLNIDGSFSELETDFGKSNLHDNGNNGRAAARNALVGFSIGVNYIIASNSGD